MEIVFISNTCSERKYQDINNIKTKDLLNPSQNYFNSLLEGLTRTHRCSSLVQITSLPVAQSNCKKRLFFAEQERDSEKRIIHYPGFLNFKYIKNIITILTVFTQAFRLLKSNSNGCNTVILCDPLVYDASIGGLLAARIFKVKTFAVVTDIPQYMQDIQKTEPTMLSRFSDFLKREIINGLFDMFYGYVFLTESMNAVCNRHHRPYIVIEGVVRQTDSSTKVPVRSTKNRIVLYAGGLHEKFGIGALIEAMRQIVDQPIELHLYGEGDYINQLQAQGRLPNNVKYNGMVERSVVFEKEIEADVLINPRPSSENFTKYSFPSKTVEYMSTGTPVLTTKLKGIPDEYFPYLYFIDDESPSGIAKSIKQVLGLPDEECLAKGEAAKKFVEARKNPIAQAERLMGLLTS